MNVSFLEVRYENGYISQVDFTYSFTDHFAYSVDTALVSDVVR